ncbi:MAG: hypothetical protein QOH70_96 [Blastocatellia bacterium]|jgi:hypothetical protein|nr:hypothetical protein [Blastocatellia bacterium]
MKRCPKCSRTYTTDTQKFCTHDGGVLEGVNVGGETVRIDSSQFDQNAPTKAISSPLVPEAGGFDPFKTIMARPQETVTEGPRDTKDISSPSATSPPASQPPPVPPAGSGQISQPPPQVSPPLPPQQPTQRLVGSGPIAASAPLPPAPQLAQTPPPQVAAPRARKKSKMPLVLGILALLFLLGGGVLGLGYWFVVRPMLARRVVEVDTALPPSKAPTPNVVATPADTGQTEKTVVAEPPAYSAPADAVEFINSKENLDGKLAEHYVDFSFYYPNRWDKDPTAGAAGATNFAKVERRIPPDFTQENFAVGSYVSAGSAEGDRAVFPGVAENLSSQLAKKFPGYRKVSEGVTKVGVYDGYGFRFEGMSKNTAKGDLKLWGRVIFLPPPEGGKDGVTLLMLATSLAPELKSVDDVGVKGELPMMLESFRFGKK